MKKLIITLAIIALVTAAGAAMLNPKPGTEKLPTETRTPTVEATARKEIEIAAKNAEAPTQVQPASAYNVSPIKAEEKTESPECTAPTSQPTTTPAPTSTGTTTAGYDPYHTDVYPNNVYSEKCTYDENGKLISKSVTMPATFGPETIWIDGHAYADVPDFGLVEWSGPSTITHVYDMYENGNKIGIMGGDDEATGEYAAPKATPECVYYTPEELANGRPPMPTTSNKPVVPDDYIPQAFPVDTVG